MKKLGLVLGIGLFLMAGKAHAQYGMAGCGLGSLLFGKDNSKLMQLLAATTNGTFGSQTFGITSGTSNCTEGGMVKAEKEQAAFAEVNFNDLKRNMAAGGGEYITSFSTLLGCEDAAKPVFVKMTQEKYEALVPSDSTTPMQLLGNVKAQIKAQPALSSSCTDARALARSTGTMTLAKK